MNYDKAVKYDVYFRKSSEAEDKQVQSIDDQRRELREFIKRNDLIVAGEFEESQSAHHPGRPVFNEVMKRIGRGTSNGLLVWHSNRISRNPVDTGTVINLIDEGKLIHVRTPSHILGNDPSEKLMLALEGAMAKKDSDDKSFAVKRGLRGRYQKGYPNGVAPIGFINDLSVEKGNRGWLEDEEKLPLIKQLFALYLSGNYSIASVLRTANDDMGLRTTLHRKQGGKKLVMSHLEDTVLKNPVYAGFFFTKDGERHELNESVPRVITEEEYWEIQKLLKDKGRPRPSTNAGLFAYVGKVKCGACRGAVTAEHKYQVICDCRHKFSYLNKTNCPKCEVSVEKIQKPKYLHYVYYHCTGAKTRNCKEGSVSEANIDEYLAGYFKENFKISKDLHDWCMANLETTTEFKAKDDSQKKTSLESTLAKKKNEYRELVLMKARGLIDESDFIDLKGTQRAEIESLEQALNKNGKTDKIKILKAKRAFDLSLGIEEIFKNGSVSEKKETLSEIGSNLTIRDKKLNVINGKLVETITRFLLTSRKENPSFEPEFYQSNKGETEAFAPVFSTLLRG